MKNGTSRAIFVINCNSTIISISIRIFRHFIRCPFTSTSSSVSQSPKASGIFRASSMCCTFSSRGAALKSSLMKYFNIASLKRHQKNHDYNANDNQVLNENFKCQKCNKYLINVGNLNRHMKNVHDVKLKCP